MFALFLQSASTGLSFVGYVIVFTVVAITGFLVYYWSSKQAAVRGSGRGRHIERQIARTLDPRAAIGGVVGGVVGYLLGTSPSLSLEDVLTRGAHLQGFNSLLQPAAEAASNWMIAGVIVGVVGGIVVIQLTSKRSTPVPLAATLPKCPNCGTPISSGMEFCGKCGKSLTVTTCGKCGKPVPQNQEFCGACGARVT